MVNLDIANLLRGDLDELYFKHLCLQRGFAYIRLKDIYNTFTPADILEFKYGFDRVPIKIPQQVVSEVRQICKPLEFNGSASFVFDFLTCRLPEKYSTEIVNVREKEDFHWVDVKSASGSLSKSQQDVLETCRIKGAVFRISDVNLPPKEVDIRIDSEIIPYK